MHVDISSFVATPVLWRVLVAAAVVGLRLGLDELVPRGRMTQRTQSRAAGRG
jgi:hypothetical protein